jgi:segregation and condensation protein B
MEENKLNPESNSVATEPVKAENKEEDNIKAVIEALLFSSDKPLLIEQIRKVLDNLDGGQIRKTIEELKSEYEQSNRGMRIYEVAGGFQMITASHFSSFLKKLFKGAQHSERLSKPALETLAIIAYKQPLSKLDIESLRKVNVDGVVSTLLDKNLIRVVGRKKAPGRPKVYGTTRGFLEYFGLKSLEELPRIENFPFPTEKQEQGLEKTQAQVGKK